MDPTVTPRHVHGLGGSEDANEGTGSRPPSKAWDGQEPLAGRPVAGGEGEDAYTLDNET